MTPAALRKLAEEATSGPPNFSVDAMREHSVLHANARATLNSLAPSLALALADAWEALNDLTSNIGGHDHWRAGGSGGTCATCEQQNAACARARAALAALEGLE